MQIPAELTVFGIHIDTMQAASRAIGGLMATVFFFCIKSFYSSRNKRNENLLIKSLGRAKIMSVDPLIPVKLVDRDGEEIDCVYGFFVLFWNRSKGALLRESISKHAPLEINVSKDAKILSYCVKPSRHDISCSLNLTDSNSIDVSFDCLNNKEYFVVSVFTTGENPTIDFTGRLFGYATAIDGARDNFEASILHRLMCAFVGTIVPVGPVFLVVSFIVSLKYYSLKMLMNNTPEIPWWLSSTFGLGAITTCMFVFYAIMLIYKRKKVPEGFPIDEDLEPSQFTVLKNLWITALTGVRHDLMRGSPEEYGVPVVPQSSKTKEADLDLGPNAR